MTSSSLICLPRWATPRSPGRPTLGHVAARIARALGTPFMPWQRQVADVALEIDPCTGRLVYREVDLTVPRQSGKTTLLLAVILTRALGARRQSIRYTAQTGSDARTKWADDWLPVLLESPFRPYFRPRLTNGHEALLFKNGSIQGLVATTKKSGHGSSVDLGILDEAFAHPDGRLEQALKPAMITRPQPQLWVVSTAGTPDASPYLWGKVENGRAVCEAGLTRSVAYFEWSADDGLDPEAPATWWSCMPALGYTVTEEAVASDFASMELNEFERAYLNRWKSALTDPVIPLAAWNELADAGSTLVGPVCFAFDVTPDRAHASIAVAGKRRDGLGHVEVIEQGAGTGWVAKRMAALVKSHKTIGVVCESGASAGSLLADMQKVRVEVTAVNAQDHAKACGVFYDMVEQQALRHLGDPVLVASIDGAVKRQTDGGAWKWARTSSSVDISPLVACTLALWGAESFQPVSARVIDLDAALADHDDDDWDLDDEDDDDEGDDADE